MENTVHNLIFGVIIQKTDLIDANMWPIGPLKFTDYADIARKFPLSAFFTYDCTLGECINIDTYKDEILGRLNLCTFMKLINSCEGHTSNSYYALIVANDAEDYDIYPEVIEKAMRYEDYVSYLWVKEQ